MTFSSICCWFANCSREQTLADKYEMKKVLYIAKVPVEYVTYLFRYLTKHVRLKMSVDFWPYMYLTKKNIMLSGGKFQNFDISNKLLPINLINRRRKYLIFSQTCENTFQNTESAYQKSKFACLFQKIIQ